MLCFCTNVFLVIFLCVNTPGSAFCSKSCETSFKQIHFMITIYCTHVPVFFCDALIDMLYIMLNAVRRKMLILKLDLYIRNHYAIRNTLVPLFTMASFILMCAKCKIYDYNYIIPLLLILCGDIELHPGPNIVMNE